MLRKIGECPDKPKNVNHHPGSEIKTYTIQLITPLFGGGAEAGVNDPITLIRSSSIRGHLRFWWRATRGAAKCSTIAELYQREGEIWGTMDNPSPVYIEVKVEEHDTPFECAGYKWDPNMRRGEGGYRLKWSAPFNANNSSLPYVLFPFQGKAPDSDDPKEPSKMIKSAQFKMITRVPSPERMALFAASFSKQRDKKGLLRLTEEDNNIEKDVEAAIWSWVNFGGIGARTRRGCGALYCLNPNDLTPPSCEGFKKWINDRSAFYGLSKKLSLPPSEREPISAKSSRALESSSREWTTLGRILLRSGSNPILCWEESIKIMKDLRQGSEGRDRGATPHPGRSRWPEPESLRKLVLKQKSLPNRPKGMHPPDHRMKITAFPRVEFGMPIIVEIRGERIKPTLQPNIDHDRMASPLILKPIGFSDGSFASLVIRLDLPPLNTAFIKPGKNDLESGHVIPSSEITGLAAYTDSPIDKFCNTGSALDAFMSFSKSRGFAEVFP